MEINKSGGTKVVKGDPWGCGTVAVGESFRLDWKLTVFADADSLNEKDFLFDHEAVEKGLNRKLKEYMKMGLSLELMTTASVEYLESWIKRDNPNIRMQAFIIELAPQDGGTCTCKHTKLLEIGKMAAETQAVESLHQLNHEKQTVLVR